MTLTSGFWYEIVYPSGELVIFQFLDTVNGELRCRLCNGEESFNLLNRPYRYLIERGEKSPCNQSKLT